jgi:hypothetical protein
MYQNSECLYVVLSTVHLECFPPRLEFPKLWQQSLGKLSIYQECLLHLSHEVRLHTKRKPSMTLSSKCSSVPRLLATPCSNDKRVPTKSFKMKSFSCTCFQQCKGWNGTPHWWYNKCCNTCATMRYLQYDADLWKKKSHN